MIQKVVVPKRNTFLWTHKFQILTNKYHAQKKRELTALAFFLQLTDFFYLFQCFFHFLSMITIYIYSSLRTEVTLPQTLLLSDANQQFIYLENFVRAGEMFCFCRYKKSFFFKKEQIIIHHIKQKNNTAQVSIAIADSIVKINRQTTNKKWYEIEKLHHHRKWNPSHLSWLWEDHFSVHLNHNRQEV